MSNRFVRSSKYRHVFGTVAKKDQCYDNLKISRNNVEGSLIKVNESFLSVNWNASGGGAFAVIPINATGKLSSDYPLVNGHTAAVIDIDFSPFNNNLIASGGEDTNVMVWNIPHEGLKENLSKPSVNLSGHGRKVTTVLFHPTAEHVLLSCSSDLTVKLWDVEHGSERISLSNHADVVQSLTWNYNGSLLATSCRDRKIRVLDPRHHKVVHEGNGHQGVKGSYILWLGDSNKILTTGFSKSSERQIGIWDMNNLSEPVKMINLDSSSGTIMPYFDNDTKMLYLSGKGDGNIRYYEIVNEDPFAHSLSEFKSHEPQRGMAFMPKRALNIKENEVARAYKVTTSVVEPISFKVPRKADVFQADIFPDTVGPEAPMNAKQFFDGKNANPILISLEQGYNAGSQSKEFTPLHVPEEHVTAPASSFQGLNQFSKEEMAPSTPTGGAFKHAVGEMSLDEMRRTIESLRNENEELKRLLKAAHQRP